MSGLRNLVDKLKPTFSEGGKLSFLASTFDAFETFLFVPNTTTQKGAHIRDCNDMKRTMIVVVVALLPALLFGMYNTGYQVGMTGWAAFWFCFSLYGAGARGFFIKKYAPGEIRERFFCWRLFAGLYTDNRRQRAGMRRNDGQAVLRAEPQQPVVLRAVVAVEGHFFGFRSVEKLDGGEAGVVAFVVVVELLLDKILENVVIHDLRLLTLWRRAPPFFRSGLPRLLRTGRGCRLR